MIVQGHSDIMGRHRAQSVAPFKFQKIVIFSPEKSVLDTFPPQKPLVDRDWELGWLFCLERALMLYASYVTLRIHELEGCCTESSKGTALPGSITLADSNLVPGDGPGVRAVAHPRPAQDPRLIRLGSGLRCAGGDFANAQRLRRRPGPGASTGHWQDSYCASPPLCRGTHACYAARRSLLRGMPGLAILGTYGQERRSSTLNGGLTAWAAESVRIKLDQTTRVASSRQHPNGTLKVTLEYDRVGTAGGLMANRGCVPGKQPEVTSLRNRA
jgi:hypothetical protein